MSAGSVRTLLGGTLTDPRERVFLPRVIIFRLPTPLDRIQHSLMIPARRPHRTPALHLVGFFVLGSAACVPFGGWLYDDPTFVLSELTVRGGGNPSDTLEMVLTACNRNDFPLQANGFVVSFEMEGKPIGSTETSVPVMLQTRDSTKLTVPIALPTHQTDNSSAFSYVLTGHAMLQTPIGERRVELFQEGHVALKPRDEVLHIQQAGKPCRPGRSTLPGYMPTPVIAPPPPDPLPLPGGQPQAQ